MATPVLTIYADLACPYAYISIYRLRQVRAEDQRPITIVHKSLALEYVNREPTPKPLLEQELPLLVRAERDIPYQPWQRPASEWPVTMWPAFEAVKCAERQSLELADELDWALRVAFFAQSRCLSLRHVLLDLAESVGLEMTRFADDFDRGATKYQVLQEAREGWEKLKVAGSPTFVLPSGTQISEIGLPDIHRDPTHPEAEPTMTPAPHQEKDRLEIFQWMVDEARRSASA